MVTTTVELLDHIKSNLDQFAVQTRESVASTKEQSKAGTEVAKQVDTSVQESASVASAASQMAATTSEVARTASEIANLAFVVTSDTQVQDSLEMPLDEIIVKHRSVALVMIPSTQKYHPALLRRNLSTPLNLQNESFASGSFPKIEKVPPTCVVFYG